MFIFFILCITVGCVTLHLHVSRHTWISIIQESCSCRNTCLSQSPMAPAAACAKAGRLSQLLQPVQGSRLGLRALGDPALIHLRAYGGISQLRDAGWRAAGASGCSEAREAPGGHTGSPSRRITAPVARRPSIPGAATAATTTPPCSERAEV
ncbi:hypothetical protein Nmel_010972 [Mimus melanotis]